MPGEYLLDDRDTFSGNRRDVLAYEGIPTDRTSPFGDNVAGTDEFGNVESSFVGPSGLEGNPPSFHSNSSTAVDLKMGEKPLISVENVEVVPLRQRTGRYACPKCGKETGRLPDMERHLRKHEAPEFLCPGSGCDKAFSRKDKLMDHQRRKHKEMGKSAE